MRDKDCTVCPGGYCQATPVFSAGLIDLMADQSENAGHAILVVDDEPDILAVIRKVYGERYKIFTAAAAQPALEIAAAQDLYAVISDQAMPGESGIVLLTQMRQLHPYVTRVLTTAFENLTVAIEAINAANVFYYLPKPWDLENLLAVTRHAVALSILSRRLIKNA